MRRACLQGALQLLPGAGDVGAAIIADERIQGVVFTGSTPVARLIEKELAGRVTRTGAPLPLIAETGGLNAMVVEFLGARRAGGRRRDLRPPSIPPASAARRSASSACRRRSPTGRWRCSKGAMAELEIGDTRALSTDVGPVITAEARDAIQGHVDAMRARGHAVTQGPLPDATAQGTFVAPALIEIDAVAEVEREVFGPVLHVLRYKREGLDRLIDAINAAGYGLTFGLHTRIDETIARVTERIEAGNIYVNRNIIGATVGVQPFGGARLSGTGPKAGGPLYLSRLVCEPPPGALDGLEGAAAAHEALRLYIRWLESAGHGRRRSAASASCRARRSARGSSFPGRSASATSMR